ncbi:MAG: peptidase M61 domain-containing [Planctomycetota bacterium]|nr:MAG: peptidase M61 domain-containing [Planctomycetota bacterium]
MRAFALLLLVAGALPCRALTVSYDVAHPRPENHTYEITMDVGDVQGGSIDLAMPAWTPGYYKIQNHARNIRDFTAKSAAGDLAWEMVDKQTWRIQTGNAGAITLRYRVYAHQLTATGADLTDEHAYFHASWICMYVVGALSTPSTLRLHPLPGWKTATGLDPAPGENTYAAPDYDILVDSPVLMGNLDIREFSAGGALHQVVLHGNPVYDRAAMTKDVEKIVNAQLAAMGAPPYKRYVFLLMFPRWGSGGLEHLNSTAIVANGEELPNRDRYLKFLFVVSHEFFHLWNVKRFRPAQLGPFDYTKEVLTKNLWVHEGFTTTYGWLSMRRGGVLNRQEYLNYVQEDLNNLMRRDGRKRTSAAASSWRTWYDADDGDDVEVSYYTSGHLIGVVLDLEIRRRTGGAKSLDDVMKLAVEKTKGAGYANDDFLPIVNEAAGSDFTEFFAKYVSGTVELPLADVFPPFGVTYEAHVDAVESDPGFDCWGIGEDLVKITRVPETGPAVDAGLDEGDILVSAEGKRLRAGTFWAFVHSKKPGDKITFQLFRGERMLEKTVTLNEKKKISHQLKLVEKPTEDQKKWQDGWLK